MSDNKFSISMDKSGVERRGLIVSSTVGLKGLYIVRSACKLRARRTVCKSVFFSNDINCWRKIRGLFGLKGRGLGDSATCRPGKYH